MITKNTPLKDVLGLAPACMCSACRHGCKFGSGMLAEGDEHRLAQFLGISLSDLKKGFLEEADQFNSKLLHPRVLKEKNKTFGKCVFYDDNQGCTVHEAKPLQCKTSMGCRDYGDDLAVWFMVNHAVNADDPESVRQYAQYIESGGKVIPGASLQELVPDREKLKKILSYEILK